MKTSRLILLTFLSLAMVFLSSCKEDEEPEVDPFVGEYVITKATISEPLDLPVNELPDPLSVPPGIEITGMIHDALLGAIECEPASTLIELRDDFSIYFSCATSMEGFNAGTWEEQSETVLVLNLNSTAIPSSPTGIILTVTDVAIAGSILSGTSSVPVPEAMLAEIVVLMSQGTMTLDTEATPDALPLTFTIEMTKQ